MITEQNYPFLFRALNDIRIDNGASPLKEISYPDMFAESDLTTIDTALMGLSGSTGPEAWDPEDGNWLDSEFSTFTCGEELAMLEIRNRNHELTMAHEFLEFMFDGDAAKHLWPEQVN